MPSIERTVTTNTPAEKVWEYLSDFTTTTEWDPGTELTTRESGDGGVGTVYKNVSKFVGMETELIYTVTAFNPPHSLSLQGENDSVTANDTITVSSEGTTTTVDYSADFDFHGAANLVSPFTGPFLKKLGDDAADSLKDALDKL